MARPGRMSPDAVVDFRPLSKDKKTTRRSPSRDNAAARYPSLLWTALSVISFLHVFVYRPQLVLQRYLEEMPQRSLWYGLHETRMLSQGLTSRYLVFLPVGPGQGTGNIMHGLLAAHLLALESDRTLCVSSSYTDFHLAFEYTSPSVVTTCQVLPQYDASSNHSNTLELINYHQPSPNETLLRQKLQSNTSVLFYVGNSYPRWPTTIPARHRLFFQCYRPTKALQSVLPSRMPRVVAHLRQGDTAHDARDGLDEATFHALGQHLNALTNNNDDEKPYLVTNRVLWYEWFAQHYDWQHPDWQAVRHSAYRSFLWGSRDSSLRPAEVNHTATKTMDNEQTQTLQMWSDWYVLLNARYILHTQSDFSQSAIHWNNIRSATIGGVDASTRRLLLVEESWRQELALKPQDYLVDRKGDELMTGEHAPDVRLPPGIRNLFMNHYTQQKAVASG